MSDELSQTAPAIPKKRRTVFVTMLAVLAALSAATSITMAFVGTLFHYLNHAESLRECAAPGIEQVFPYYGSLIVGVLLIITAIGLFKRRRLAWILAVTTLVAGIVWMVSKVGIELFRPEMIGGEIPGSVGIAESVVFYGHFVFSFAMIGGAIVLILVLCTRKVRGDFER